jgi:hypothetical protein
MPNGSSRLTEASSLPIDRRGVCSLLPARSSVGQAQPRSAAGCRQAPNNYLGIDSARYILVPEVSTIRRLRDFTKVFEPSTAKWVRNAASSAHCSKKNKRRGFWQSTCTSWEIQPSSFRERSTCSGHERRTSSNDSSRARILPATRIISSPQCSRQPTPAPDRRR